MTLGMTVSASEFTIADVETILYTNEKAELLSNADANSVVLNKEEMPDHAPILVTGITSNGNAYYEWYVAPTTDAKFSFGHYSAKYGAKTAEDMDKYMIRIGMNVSGSINESMINRDESIPLGERRINTPECPAEVLVLELVFVLRQ